MEKVEARPVDPEHGAGPGRARGQRGPARIKVGSRVNPVAAAEVLRREDGEAGAGFRGRLPDLFRPSST